MCIFSVKVHEGYIGDVKPVAHLIGEDRDMPTKGNAHRQTKAFDTDTTKTNTHRIGQPLWIVLSFYKILILVFFILCLLISKRCDHFRGKNIVATYLHLGQ